MKKFICMKDGCTFCTDDLDDALEHLHFGRGHRVVEVDADDSCHCHDLGAVVEEPQFEEEEI